MLEFFNQLAVFAREFVATAGYAGVFTAAFLENFFPPIPSELIFPFVGFVAAGGKLDLFLVILAATLGAALSSTFWYGLGYLLGRANLKELVNRWGGYLRIHFHDVEKAESWFERYDRPAVFLGRFIPLVRTFISIPAGFVRMSFGWFLLLSFAGTFLWIGILTTAGYLLGERWEEVVPFFENYNLIFEVFLVILVVLLFVKFYRQHAQRASQKRK